MIDLLAIDPGKTESYCALFQHDCLVHAFTTDEADGHEALSTWGCDEDMPSYCIIEQPEIYPGISEKRPNDQIDLAVAAGIVAGVRMGHGGSLPEFVRPREWKGNTPKWIHHRRIWRVLNEDERSIIASETGHTPAMIHDKINAACLKWATGQVTKRGLARGYSWKAHNILDAVALGLWKIGRTGRGGKAL